MRKLTSLFLFAVSLTAAAQTHVMDVNTNKLGAPVQPTMYGIFFEDINYAADGGLYAEMVKNRSFEFPQHLMGWRAFGNFDVEDEGGPFDRNPHYVRLKYSGHSDKFTGLENEGFFGIGVMKDKTYRFSLWARCPEGGKSTLEVSLVDNATMGEDQRFATVNVEISGKEWKKYTATLASPRTDPKAALRLFLMGDKATTDVEHISLFPTDTWKGRENGMRRDLAQALCDMHPGVFRFPGGCIVEGTDLDTRYEWKKSVGPTENRPMNENRWNYTFPHRMSPLYYQSLGIGFYEYFLLSEYIGAEPLPILSCGMACQYQNRADDPKAFVSGDALEEFIQDALDLIEFANGDASTRWGSLRASMGHPAPFNMKYIGIGNEQWGEGYPERLQHFVKAIRAKYPKMQIVGSAGPSPDGKDFDYGWQEMRRLKVDLVDEHYYRSPEWFLKNTDRYDNYSRKGPKVFAGEYACHVEGQHNDFYSALCEAAFMTGLERNADVVRMATYAPLFAHVDGWQWRPDLIWFDNLKHVCTPNYYVQQMYSMNRGTRVLPVSGAEQNLYASAVWDEQDNSYIVKMANLSGAVNDEVTIQLKGKKKVSTASVTLLSTDMLTNENSVDNPDLVHPVELDRSALKTDGNTVTLPLWSHSFYVVRVKAE